MMYFPVQMEAAEEATRPPQVFELVADPLTATANCHRGVSQLWLAIMCRALLCKDSF